LGIFFESLAVRDLRIHTDVLDGKEYHYRDSSGLEIDAIVELPDERWAAFVSPLQYPLELVVNSFKNCIFDIANTSRLSAPMGGQRL
jgi:hypothetical protein